MALLAGCASSPLTDSRKILSNAETSLKNLKSVHFQIEAGGQFIIGVQESPSPSPTPVPTVTPTATPTPTSTPTPAPTGTATPSPGPTRSPSPTTSAQASAAASAQASAAASASASASESAARSAVASALASAEAGAAASASASAAASANASAAASAAASALASAAAAAVPTPTPIYTSMPIALNGSSAYGDIDFVNDAAHITGGVPGIPSMSGEVIIVNTYAYVRSPGGTQYASEGVSDLPINPADPSGPLFVVQQMVALADDPSVDPVLVGIEQEQYGSCYHIRVDVTKGGLNSKLASLNLVQLLGSGALDLWITEGSFQLERLEFSTSDPSAGAAAVRLVLSNWNNVSPILAPPASEVQLNAPAAS